MIEYVKKETILAALVQMESEVADGYGFQYEKWREYFSELSADVVVEDSITRKNAIDAVDNTWWNARGIRKGIKEAPSSNPTVVCCSDHKENSRQTDGDISDSVSDEKDNAEKWICESLYDQDGDCWNIWRCKSCGFKVSKGWKDTEGGRKPSYNFCPNCGL